MIIIRILPEVTKRFLKRKVKNIFYVEPLNK